MSVDPQPEQRSLLNPELSTQKYFMIRHRASDGTETDEALGYETDIALALKSAIEWAGVFGTEIIGICEAPVQP
jgi:hypothetical protein